MALDGIVIANLVKELRDTIEGGHISKISMPEKDELLLTVNNNSKSYRLLISSSASLPLMYLTDVNKKSPLIAPGFCMLLRKHIGSGKITDIRQSGLERIVCFCARQLNELGDPCEKRIYVELMGKYSNIIFTDDHDMIIDSMKHVPGSVSSLREVLPGRKYFLPEQLRKLDPLSMNEKDFENIFSGSRDSSFDMPVGKALVSMLSGISPVVSEEICHLADISSAASAKELSDTERARLTRIISLMTEDIRNGNFKPAVILRNNEPVEFSSLPLTCLETDGYSVRHYDSVSRLLSDYYARRETVSRTRQKNADLRKLTSNLLERCVRKYELQSRQLKDSEKKEKYRIYGDLLNTYGYELKGGEKELKCNNYYEDNKEIIIPLDEHLSASQNARHYFGRYDKMKRTEEAVSTEIRKTNFEITHLNSIISSLDFASEENDLNQIREELTDYGYIHKKIMSGKKTRIISQPMHFVSSDGFDIYIGKNNYQNEDLTFKFASGNDWWFHAKGVPGSHVIVKSENRELPDRTYEEAAALAAYYSKAGQNEKVEVDYLQRKSVKKTPGSPPGFVIYHTNWSMVIRPQKDIS